MEEWKDVVGYEGLYEVSNMGNVRRDGFILKTWLSGANGKMYHYVSLSTQGSVQKKRVHCLVALAFLPNPNNLPVVDHINGDEKDNQLSNLKWETRRGNWLNPTNRVRQVGRSGHKNIFQNHENWMVRINVNGAIRYIGTFKTIEEAITARDEFLTGK